MSALPIIGIEFTVAAVMWGIFTRPRARSLAMIAFAGATLAFISAMLLPRYFVLPLYFTPLVEVLALAEQAQWNRFFDAYTWPALFAAAWLTGPALRQSIFEVRTLGYLTNFFDACTYMLIPMVVPLATGATIVAGMMLATLKVPPAWQRGAVIVAAVVIVVAGAWGWAAWSALGSGRPCL